MQPVANFHRSAATTLVLLLVVLTIISPNPYGPRGVRGANSAISAAFGTGLPSPEYFQKPITTVTRATELEFEICERHRSARRVSLPPDRTGDRSTANMRPDGAAASSTCVALQAELRRHASDPRPVRVDSPGDQSPSDRTIALPALPGVWPAYDALLIPLALVGSMAIPFSVPRPVAGPAVSSVTGSPSLAALSAPVDGTTTA